MPWRGHGNGVTPQGSRPARHPPDGANAMKKWSARQRPCAIRRRTTRARAGRRRCSAGCRSAAHRCAAPKTRTHRAGRARQHAVEKRAAGAVVGDVVDDERVFEDAELAEQLAELLVLGMRQVGVARGHALECQQVDVREAEVLALRAVVHAVLERGDPGNLRAQLPERARDLRDLTRARPSCT